jgi:tetratricopeptide (TPR) repeat protein
MEKENELKITCPKCNRDTTMTQIQYYQIDKKNYADNYSLNNTDDQIEPEMSKMMYEILKDTCKEEITTTGQIAIIGKHRVGGLLSKPCDMSEKFTKVFMYYFMDHENQLGGFTFRMIEEMIPVGTSKLTMDGMEVGYTFRPKHDKIQKSDEYVGKGVELRQLGRYDEAISCYQKALDIDPTNSSAWSSMGVIVRQLGRPEEALACYDRALKINPNDWRIWLNKGTALDELKNHQEALDCFKKANEIEPGNPNIINSIEEEQKKLTPP